MHEIKHRGTQDIYTERLHLRKARLGDEYSMFRYTSDPEMTKFVGWEAHKSVDETRENFIEKRLNGYADDAYRWVICEKGSDDVIGTIDVAGMFGFATVEAGYAIARVHWNKGYATEALKAVIDYMFEMGVHRVQAKHNVLNIGSGRAMEKAGMTKEGVLRGMAWQNGTYADFAIWGIIREDGLA